MIDDLQPVPPAPIVDNQIFDISNAMVEGEYVSPTVLKATISSIQVDSVAIPVSNDSKYRISPTGIVDVIATIEGGESINMSDLKLVAERQSDNRPSGEEIYFSGDIVNGVITVSGSFPVSSNWKIEADRNNRALKRRFAPMPCPINLTFKTIDFLS